MTDPRLILASELVPQLLRGADARLEVLRKQFALASVNVESETNWGFFAKFSMPHSTHLLANETFCGGDAQIEVKGLHHPAGAILYVENGALSFLEVYTFDEPWEDPPAFGQILSVVPIIPGENRREEIPPRAT